jgi:hypothetical protein
VNLLQARLLSWVDPQERAPDTGIFMRTRGPVVPPADPQAGGKACGWASMTKLAKYRPTASLITVTLDGTEGSGRDQRTGTSPIFGSRSFPLGSTRKPALAVNRIACR